MESPGGEGLYKCVFERESGFNVREHEGGVLVILFVSGLVLMCA